MSMTPSSFFFILFLHLLTIFSKPCNGKELQKFTAVFVFGDSTVDSGNNNYKLTPARANYSPYGMSFPGKISTGRFSDGKIVPDFVSSMLGIKETVPPYLDPYLSDYDLRTGVNFASGGSGYAEETNAIYNVISMTKQLEYFKEYIERLRKIVGNDQEAEKIISGSYVIVSGGVVDFLRNFYNSPKNKLHTRIEEYQDVVLDKLQNFVKELYNLGCRVINIVGLPPLGCLPVRFQKNAPNLRKCVQVENSDSQMFNIKLAKLLPSVQETLKGSTVFYGDIFNPLMDMTINPVNYGFVETNRGCCRSGLTGVLCTNWLPAPVCPNPSQFLFFDSMHPTQEAYKYLAEALLNQLLQIFSQSNMSCSWEFSSQLSLVNSLYKNDTTTTKIIF